MDAPWQHVLELCYKTIITPFYASVKMTCGFNLIFLHLGLAESIPAMYNCFKTIGQT